MKVAVLGTGMVGQAQAKKLAELGHQVIVGTRSPKNDEGSYSDAAQHGELVIEAISGQVVVQILKGLSKELKGKTLIDISNALDFSGGEIKITTANGESLGEQIQKALPETNVVKAFNTMNASVQVNPQSVAGGDHDLFIAGNDTKAKERVIKLSKEYGWKNIIDLGDLKAARGMEMLMPFWLTLRGQLGHSSFNYKIAQ